MQYKALVSLFLASTAVAAPALVPGLEAVDGLTKPVTGLTKPVTDTVGGLTGGGLLRRTGVDVDHPKHGIFGNDVDGITGSIADGKGNGILGNEVTGIGGVTGNDHNLNGNLNDNLNDSLNDNPILNGNDGNGIGNGNDIDEVVKGNDDNQIGNFVNKGTKDTDVLSNNDIEVLDVKHNSY